MLTILRGKWDPDASLGGRTGFCIGPRSRRYSGMEFWFPSLTMGIPPPFLKWLTCFLKSRKVMSMTRMSFRVGGECSPSKGGVMGWEIDWMGWEYYVSVSRDLDDLKIGRKWDLNIK